MGFNSKNVTQGGQVVFYMVRMFLEINKIISHYFILGFLLLSGMIFFLNNIKRYYAIKMGYYYYMAKFTNGLSKKGTLNISLGDTKLTVNSQDILNHNEFIIASDFLKNQIFLSLGISFFICSIVMGIVYHYIGNTGKKQSTDDYLAGRKFEKNPATVEKILKKEKINSDIVIGRLPIIKNSEIQNFLAHGTVGTGKSTLINQFIKQILIRQLTNQGDKVIVYDKGCSFIQKFYDESKDYILNSLDERTSNWWLWDECKTKPDFDSAAAALIPAEAQGDPFWQSSARTIFAIVAYEMGKTESPSYKKLLQNLLALDLPALREMIEGTEAGNLVDEKAEKTAISIRSVLTNYVKSIVYLQGIDESGTKKRFTIKDWMTDENDKGVLYLTSNGAQHESLKPVISLWLSIAINSLFRLGESRDRRVWFIVDEITSLHKLPALSTILAEGRKFGACFLIGLQNIAQLEDVYNTKGSASLLDLLNTRYFFRSPNYDIAKKVSEQIGKTRFDVFKEQYSYGKTDTRDGVMFSKQEQEKEIVGAADIMQLPDLTCYVTYPAEVPVTKLKLKYVRYPNVTQGFVEREVDTSIVNEIKKIKPIDVIKKKISTAQTTTTGNEVDFIPQSNKAITIKPNNNETIKVNQNVIDSREELNINDSHSDRSDYDL